ncbi:MAG: Gfo/Idh/MocA family oxidoreductase [Verrucomicrobia bacterium]|nr:Gfo/Idh/MocA family oxidoreductase [Verrucomicrobiota bacterium]
MNETSNLRQPTSRRQFLKASSSVALGGMVGTKLAFSGSSFAQNSETLRVGLIGCGGRGSGAASQALRADKNVILTAMGDAFSNKLNGSLNALQRDFPDRVKVDPDHSFVGLDAYQKVLASGVDVVILATPPGFRPLHFKAAVDSNKHIFCEKPMATDSPGVRTVMAAVEEAKKKKLAVVAGFCWRYDYARRALFQRVHEGAVGDLRALYHCYYTGPVKPMPPAADRPQGMSDVEWQLRNWYNFVWLSGDGYVEQAVHSVDKLAWAMRDMPPVKCTAVGGRQIPNNEGNIYDHIEVNYEYPTGVRGFVVHRQITNCHGGVHDHMMGTKGVANITGERRRPLDITGENAWEYKGPTPDMYQVEHDELFASIRAGTPINDGVRMCTSTLLAIMGRTAAYTGQEISWDQVLNSQDKLVPDQLEWNMALPIAPMAMPGRTRFG